MKKLLRLIWPAILLGGEGILGVSFVAIARKLVLANNIFISSYPFTEYFLAIGGMMALSILVFEGGLIINAITKRDIKTIQISGKDWKVIRQKYQAMKSDVQQLTEQKKELDSNLAQTKSDLEGKEKELLSEQANVQRLTEQKRELDSNLAQTKSDLEGKKKEHLSAQANVQRLAEQKRELDSNLAQTKSDLEGKEKELLSEQANVQRLTEQKRELDSNLAQTKSDLEGKKKEHLSAQANVQRLAEQKRELDSNLAQTKSDLEGKEKELLSEQANVQRLTEQKRELDSNLAQTKSDLEGKKKEHLSAQANVQRLTEQKRELDSNLAQAKRDLEEKEKELQSAQADIQRLSERTKEFESELAASQNTISRIRSDVVSGAIISLSLNSQNEYEKLDKKEREQFRTQIFTKLQSESLSGHQSESIECKNGNCFVYPRSKSAGGRRVFYYTKSFQMVYVCKVFPDHLEYERWRQRIGIIDLLEYDSFEPIALLSE